MALIVGAALIAAVGLYLYFSPYQQCLRAKANLARSGGYEQNPDIDVITCARAMPS
jgi:hypothetical protein